MPSYFDFGAVHSEQNVVSVEDTPVGSTSGRSSPEHGEDGLTSSDLFPKKETLPDAADKPAPPPKTTNSSLEALQSAGQRNVLNIVDSLRQCGLDGIVSLPQLVVCGDQSSGKSSVLEAITEIPFPRKEQLCTRFATEIVLRRAATSSISTRIIPDKARPNSERKALEAFKKSITNFGDLPSLIDSATEAMGIADKGDGTATRAFAKDVLSIEISGPDRPQLTLVDLPGLVHSENKSQTKEDVQVVSDLVDEYISNPRTIILPVISAKNDYANQVILKRARHVDPEGNRTLGIITKPDDLYPGSENEAAFVALAKNEDIFFKLGWHILKNRGFKERNDSFEQRNYAEKAFFNKGTWAKLPRHNVGIETLRTRLSDLLFNHIKKELPKLRQDLEEKLEETRRELQQMGEKRITTLEQRQYLVKLSAQFSAIVKASVNGNYEMEYFLRKEKFSESAIALKTRRLRAMIAHLNAEFASRLRRQGHKYKFEGHSISTELGDNCDIDEATEVKDGEETEDDGDLEYLKPCLLNKERAITWVQDCINRNRGKELSGHFNPLLVGELFWEQSEHWEALAREHAANINTLCTNFAEDLLEELCLPDVFSRLQTLHVEDVLKKRFEGSELELAKIVADNRRHPITYNHYFTMTLEKLRKTREGGDIDQRVKDSTTTLEKWTSPNYHHAAGEKLKMDVIDANKLKSSLKESRSGVNMDEHACQNALDSLQAYYKVALKTFTDNIPIQVIERHLIDGLEEIFSPIVVSGWDDGEILTYASEPQALARQREFLEARKKVLEDGRGVFRKVMRAGA